MKRERKIENVHSQQARNYKSLYSDRNVTVNQHIVELLCYNRALDLNIELPQKFWQNSTWKSFYTLQSIKVSGLLKTYPSEFLIKLIRDNKIWSVSIKWVNDLIAKEYKNYTPPKTYQTIEVVENPTFHKTKETKLDYLD